MIVFERDVLRHVIDAAEAAYPHECCGLLVGRPHPNGTVAVTRAHPSANLGKAPDRFEIDPRLWVDLARALGRGPTKVVGLYHSHPDGPAQPSAADLEAAWGEEMVWIIVSVARRETAAIETATAETSPGAARGQAIHVTAHILDHGGRQFRELPLRTADWHPYAERAMADEPTKDESTT